MISQLARHSIQNEPDEEEDDGDYEEEEDEESEDDIQSDEEDGAPAHAVQEPHNVTKEAATVEADIVSSTMPALQATGACASAAQSETTAATTTASSTTTTTTDSTNATETEPTHQSKRRKQE
jgi:hypothetical protein